MFVFQLSYYSSLLILMVIAINRMLTVVLPNSSKLTEERAVRFIAAIIYPTAFLLTLIADYVLPCCRTNYSYKTYSYQFFVWNENTINYKNNLIDLPLNIITTIIIFICYGAIIARVVIANRKDVIKLSTNIELKKNRRKSEIKCALHFALISTFHIAVWVSYRIFPLIVSLSTPEWYSLTGFFMILNISSNSIIYFTMNKEVQKQLIIFYRKLFGLPISNNLTIPTYLNNINLINSNSKNILNPNGQEKWANRRITQPQLINTSL
ncbi:hypothetical protein Mgra_00007992 [Meloidogyne graminicola]|uniref:G-protein coupled receptors family 1 profile domain-containing protein n=1 Tax=Meloidogyne graminicola TaxID=189291 RepID=A0A8S9ZH31_9BILA|nr:hypothetical protein Mgra_00007992 [Meloidogyne graminicola]